LEADMRTFNIGSLAQPCPRLVLRHGQLYTLTLERSGMTFVLMAWNLHPTHFGWTLIELDTTCPTDVHLVELSLNVDGTFEPGGDFDVDDTGRLRAFEEEGPTVRDLVPADGLAVALWVAQFGNPSICPRCDATADAPHHPLCHTAGGVPLFPDRSRDAWLGDVEDQCADWTQEIGLNGS
jgi:hypothetical protein